MAYVIDTPSQCLDSYIILTPANVGLHLDSFLFHTSADSQPGQRHPVPKYMTIAKDLGWPNELTGSTEAHSEWIIIA